MRGGWGRWAVVALVAVVVVSAGCGAASARVIMRPVMRISGRIAGENIAARQAGDDTLALLTRARVTCNGTSASPALDGTYFLLVPHAARYVCTVRAPAYQSQVTTIPSTDGSIATLDFDAASAAPCAMTRAAALVMHCARLALEPGTITGVVTYAGSAQPAIGIGVQCEDSTEPFGSIYTAAATTDSHGAFTIAGVPVSTYGCVVVLPNGDAHVAWTRVAPAATSSVRIQLCRAGCPTVAYHGGTIMHAAHIYLIYWLPSGYHFDPLRGDTFYEDLVSRYVRDVGGTAFYHLLTQYYDAAGPVQNSVTLAGTFNDQAPYQHCASLDATTCTPIAASTTNPLVDADIQAEVSRAMRLQGWQAGTENEFFVLLGAGAQVCNSLAAHAECSYLSGNRGACSWHNSFATADGTPVIYAAMFDPGTNTGGCMTPLSPNGDMYADTETDLLSHEQFESVTDPLTTFSGGWYADSQGMNGEISDLCLASQVSVAADGADVTLRHGDRYLLQSEWSDAAGGCALQ